MKFKERLKRSFQKSSFLDRNRNINKDHVKKCEIKGHESDAMDCKKDTQTVFKFRPPNLIRKDRRSFKTQRTVLQKGDKCTNQMNYKIDEKDQNYLPKSHRMTSCSKSADIKVQMPSLIRSGKETVNFSDLVKTVNYPDRCKQKRLIHKRQNEMKDYSSDESEGNEQCDGENETDTKDITTQTVNKDMAKQGDKVDILNRDTSPTCSDIYGNDEMENVTFGFCANLMNLKQKQIKDSDGQSVNSGLVNGLKKDLSQKVDGASDNGKIRKFGMDLTNDVRGKSELMVEEKGENETGIDNPWVLQEHLRDNDVEVLDTESYCSVEVMNKSLQHLQVDCAEDPLYSSLGFDVSNNDGLKSVPNHRKLTRTHSIDSVDSFGSSVHSVHSDEFFFSDSEAEHDIDQITTVDKKMSKKKQLIPYSLCEQISDGTDTPKKSRIFNSKSLEEKINEFAKQIIQKVDGKDSDELSDKKKEFGTKHSRSLDESLPADNGRKDLSKISKQNRRSLDSSFNQKDYMYQTDELGKRKSLLTSSTEQLLTPVLEAEGKVSAKMKSPKKTDEDDSKKFYTLPNPRKRKSATPVRRKSSRLGSISKMFSEKAYSLTNLKLGSSFKLRNETDDSNSDTAWSQLSLSANSLANMMVKKASNISTMIRKRSNSNTMSTDFADSPFNTFGKKKNKVKKEDGVELVYEKVLVNVPRKRQVTAREEKSIKKKLKLNLDLTLDSPDSRLPHSISQSSSFGVNLVKSDSQSPLRSPTLLDEIMKSVDAAGVHRMCSMIGEDDDDELSSDCDSSSGSSLFLFQKRYSLESDISDKKRDSLMLTYCKVCGRIRDLSDGSTESSDGDVKISPRHSVSLCDLTNPCTCCKRKNGHRRFSKQNQTGKRRSWVIMGYDDKSDITRPPGLPKSISLGGKSFSSNDLRRSDRSLNSVANENLEGADSEKGKAIDAIPGSLLRHEPVLDLSVDSLNKTIESEFDFVRHEERKSYSCGSLGDRKYDRKSDDEDSFHSCTDVSETDTSNAQNEKQRPKSHSCGNLLSPNDILVCDQLSKKELVRKEVRKIKVKSMSSSHDVLNQIGDIDAIDINVDEIESKANVVKENMYNEMNHGKADENCECLKANVNDDKDGAKKTEGTKDRKLSNQNLNDKNVDNESSRKVLNENDKTLRVPNIVIHDAKVTSKPPLPFHKTHKRFQSLNDVHPFENKENLQKHRYSLGDDLSDNFDVTKNFTVDLGKSESAKMTGQSKAKPSRFLFDEKTIAQLNSLKKSGDPRKSRSSNNISDLEKIQTTPKEKLLSIHSMTTINQDSYPDDVFSPKSIVSNEIPHPLCDNRELPSLTSPGLEPHELPPFGEECVYKYDVCLGYLLHSFEYDDTVICMYSLQRNKQFMESMITPLAALPGSPNSRPSSQQNSTVNKSKTPSKIRQEETPNPAAPITKVPSVRLAHAGHVIRTVLLARAAHMIRDRKFHLRTYRRCMVGTEMVDWLLQQSPLVHSRTQAVGMWQALVEEGVVVHVCHEHQFKDKYLFYRFHEDDEGVSTVPSTATKRECEDDLQDVFLMLAQIGPDAMMRMILRKPAHERTTEDLEIIYEELLHIKALSHLSTMVKRELASVLVFESHDKAGTVLFNQGDEGKSWYIILKGSVNVVIYGKGVVCTLHEGDDFGKLALVNDAPRAATIVLRDDNCHFLRVDKDDFNRILRDVEANTVRLKEHGQDVLVLEKIPSNTQTADGSVQAHYKYSVMAGTPEKMLEHLLESRLDNRNEQEIDGFLEDFLLTHVIFMPYNHLCPVLLSHYHSSTADSTEQEGFEFMLNHKKCVLHFVQEWVNIVGAPFKQDHTINAFLEELLSCVMDDLEDYPTLKDDLVALETILNAQNGSPNSKLKKKSSATFLLSKKQSKESLYEAPRKRTPFKPSDEFVFRVYCADHSYTTLKLPMAATVEQVLSSTIEKLGLGEDLILCEVKSTGERIIFKENDLCVTTGLSINGQLFVTPKEHIDALTALPEQDGPTEGTFTTIEMFSSREMAYQMTLYDWELFTCVQEYELIYQVFGRHKFGKITANLDVFLRRFNEIQFWIVSEMVLAANLSKRVSLLRKFIKLAAHCKEYRNLNSFFAIVMGLSNIAVSRLSQTWEKLPSKFKKMFADFETLMDPSRNHRVYRLSVAKMSPPIIPFMPLLMKDMTFTHEGNKTYFDGLVNFEKMHMIAQTLKTVQFCRSSPLDIEPPNTMKSSDTADYIRDLQVIDNQRCLTKLSHKLEPRKT